MSQVLQTRCCIVGGGPAGMMLGFLLARMGIDVIILEQHADFLRDFRGDTIHPSTLELMRELGLLEEFLRLPHQEIREISAQIGQDQVTLGDFTHLPTHCRFVALMPQWDFLKFLKSQAGKFPSFHLKMETEATDLIESNGAIAGVRAKTKEGATEIRAALTIGADGRHSIVRKAAGLPVKNFGVPIDVFWMRISRKPDDPQRTFGHVEQGKMLVMLNRDKYWQCAFVIPKGEAEHIKQRGMEAFREDIAQMEPFLRDRVQELQEWDKDVSLLTVSVDRLSRWYRPGLLCIGDAAHAMSPVGGVGINLAIQDAVATANLIGPILLDRVPSEHNLQAVQRRRTFPTWATQGIQVLIQDKLIRKVLNRSGPMKLPWLLKLLRHWPILRRIPARIVGLGFRPEHIQTSAKSTSQD